MSSLPHDEPAESRLDEVLAEYMQQLDRGELVDQRQFIAEHPDLADELRAFFATSDEVERMAGPPLGDTIHSGAAQPDSVPPLDKLRYFGDYELLDEIARGGMGIVYKARQVSLNRIVAVKMILAGNLAGDSDIRRFQAEAEAAANLDHSGIVPIYEVGQHQGQHFFSMGFVEGQSLAERIAARPLPPREAAELVMLVASSVQYAHDRGIVHRDLKPANILVDADGKPRITDFGLAKRTTRDIELTATGQVLGTPSYMPPEQALSKHDRVGPPADIYALGAILYAAITGRPPFQAASALETLVQVRETEPVSPRLLNPSVPKDLETICLKCLEKEPRQRYATASALADDLRRWLHDEPILARPIGSFERLWRWGRKQKRSALVATAAAAAAVVLVVGGLAAWNSYEAAQLGTLRLTTEGRALYTAEVLDEHDELALPPFTVPMKEPLSIPAGAYRVRISGEGQLSETYLLDVAPDSHQQYNVSLDERPLASPIALFDPARAAIVDLGSGADVILLPDLPSDNTPRTLEQERERRDLLRRWSGATLNAVWAQDWSANSTTLATLLHNATPTEEDRQSWQWVLHWCTRDARDNRLQLVQPPVDLDGDGVPDLVWITPGNSGSAPRRAPVLVAVSGASGVPLWWHRGKEYQQPAEQNTFYVNDRVIGMPVAVKADGAKSDLVMICTNSVRESWIERVSGQTGETLWRFPLDPAWYPAGGAIEPYPPKTATIAGKAAVVTVANTWLVALDSKTGEPIWPAHDLGFAPYLAPQVVDLDGDGQDDLLVVDTSAIPSAGGNTLYGYGWKTSTARPQLKAVSLATPATLWQAPIDGAPQRLRPRDAAPEWPQVLPPMRERESASIAVPLGPFTGDVYAGFCGLALLDGATGKPRWQRTLSAEQGYFVDDYNHCSPERYGLGPDLDGDGVRDLIVVSARRDPVPARGIPASPESERRGDFALFVDALSGANGRSLWWSRIPTGDATVRGAVSGGQHAGIDPLVWTVAGIDGKPELFISAMLEASNGAGARKTFVVELQTGKLAHIGDDFWYPRLADIDHDGLPDLCAFVPDNKDVNSFGELTSSSRSGVLRIWRSGPTERWRRFGQWEPTQDFDGDGFTEALQQPAQLGPPGNADQQFTIVSGKDGGMVGRRQVEWHLPSIANHPAYGNTQQHVPPLPLGDLDGDGVGDILVSSQFTYMRDASRPVDLHAPIPFPLQAQSGKTGGTLWEAPAIEIEPLPRGGANAYLKIEATEPIFLDVEGRGQPIVLCPYDLERDAPSGQRVSDVGLVALSARDGKRLWATTFVSGQSLTGYNNRTFFLIPAARVADLNHDGHPDLVLLLGVHPGSPAGWSWSLHALDGRDGKPLWPAHPLEAHCVDPVAPLVGTLDDAGQEDIVLPDAVQTGSFTTCKIVALSGATGAVKWSSEWRDNEFVGTMNINTGAISIEAALADLDGDGKHCVALARSENGGEPRELVIFEPGGQVRSKWSAGPNSTRGNFSLRGALDVNGDGRDELLLCKGYTLSAAAGASEPALWQWQPPAAWVGPRGVDIRPARAGRPTTLVMRQGDTIALDAASGAPIFRASTDGYSPARDLRVLGAEFEGLLGGQTEGSDWPVPKFTLPAAGGHPCLVSFGHNRTVSREAWPTRPSGEYVPPAVAVIKPAADAPIDPRLLRRLPWGHTEEFYAWQTVRDACFAALLSWTVLVLPAWLVLEAIRRRTWSLRAFLAVPAVVGLGIALYQWLTKWSAAHQVPMPGIMAGLPAAVLVGVLASAIVRARWGRAAIVALLWMAASLAFGAYLLWRDRADAAGVRYDWTGWYRIFLEGVYVAGPIILWHLLVNRPIIAIWRFFRRRRAEKRPVEMAAAG